MSKVLFLLFLAGMVGTQWLGNRLPSHFPPFSESFASGSFLTEGLLAEAGLRRVAADIAWMRLLQTCVPYHRVQHKHKKLVVSMEPEYFNCHGFDKRAWQVVRTDPYFQEAYFYTSLTLAFEPALKNPVEAVQLLKYGISFDPQNIYLKQYLGIIAYQSQGEFARALPLMERAAFARDTPAILLSLLAKLYEKKGEWDKALRTWKRILNGPEKNFHRRAEIAIEEIKSKKTP